MKVEFEHFSKEARVPHIAISFERDVATLPRVGDHIVRHRDDGKTTSTTFVVRQVTHVFEDRASYRDKEYGGDRIVVTMQALSREVVATTFKALIEAP